MLKIVKESLLAWPLILFTACASDDGSSMADGGGAPGDSGVPADAAAGGSMADGGGALRDSGAPPPDAGGFADLGEPPADAGETDQGISGSVEALQRACDETESRLEPRFAALEDEQCALVAGAIFNMLGAQLGGRACEMVLMDCGGILEMAAMEEADCNDIDASCVITPQELTTCLEDAADGFEMFLSGLSTSMSCTELGAEVEARGAQPPSPASCEVLAQNCPNLLGN